MRGWQLWIDQLTGLTNLTVDKVTARQSLVALELLIEQVRSVCGQLVVSAANGKIKDVVKQGDNYRIVFEQESGFVAHDLMRCAVTGGETKSILGGGGFGDSRRCAGSGKRVWRGEAGGRR